MAAFGAVIGPVALAWGVDNTLPRVLADRHPGQVVLAKAALGTAATAMRALLFGEPLPSATAALALLTLLAVGASGYGLSLRFYLLAHEHAHRHDDGHHDRRPEPTPASASASNRAAKRLSAGSAGSARSPGWRKATRGAAVVRIAQATGLSASGLRAVGRAAQASPAAPSCITVACDAAAAPFRRRPAWRHTGRLGLPARPTAPR